MTEKLEILAKYLNSPLSGFYKKVGVKNDHSKFSVENGQLVQRSVAWIDDQPETWNPDAFYAAQVAKLAGIASEKKQASPEREIAREVLTKALELYKQDYELLDQYWRKGAMKAISEDSEEYKALDEAGKRKAYTRERQFKHLDKQKARIALSPDDWNDPMDMMRRVWRQGNQSVIEWVAKAAKHLGKTPPVETEFKPRGNDEEKAAKRQEVLERYRAQYEKMGVSMPTVVELGAITQWTSDPDPIYNVVLKFDQPFDVDKAIADTQNALKEKWKKHIGKQSGEWLEMVKKAVADSGLNPAEIAAALNTGIIDPLNKDFDGPQRGEFARALDTSRGSRPSRQ